MLVTRQEYGNAAAKALAQMLWWTLDIPTHHIQTINDMLVWSKYMHAVTMMAPTLAMILQEELVVDMTLRSLLKTQHRLNGVTRARLHALFQVDRLELLVEREAGNLIRKWKRRASGDGKVATTSAETLRQLEKLPANTAWQRHFGDTAVWE